MTEIEIWPDLAYALGFAKDKKFYLVRVKNQGYKEWAAIVGRNIRKGDKKAVVAAILKDSNMLEDFKHPTEEDWALGPKDSLPEVVGDESS